MPRKLPEVNLLELRKELLIAESEINRAHLVEEWEAMSDGIPRLLGRVKALSSIASAVAVVIAGVSAFRRGTGTTTEKTSWFHLALKGAKMAVPIWLAFRARKR